MSKRIADTCGWVALAGDYRQHPPMQGDQTTDWAIIGGGFTGLAAARRLAELRPDNRIVLLEGKRSGQGATGRNSGFVVANESPGPAALASADGRAAYAALHALDVAGVSELTRRVQQHRIACQWQDTPSIHAAANPRNFASLRTHAAAFAEMGIDAELLDGEALQARLGTGYYALGVQSRGGALVQPAMLAKGLADCLPQQVELFENTPVTGIAPDGTVTHAGGTLKAAKVIVAVNAFLPRLGLYRSRVFPLALTASLTRPLSDAEISVAPWGILSPQALGATLRLTQDRRLLIRNTAEYRPGGISTLAGYRRFHLAALRKRFPWLDDGAIEYTWSGNIAVSRNSRPAFAAVSDRIYAAGCYNASGVARGSIMGRLVADLANAEPSELLDHALSLAPPTNMPPRPFMDVGVKAHMVVERLMARGET